MFILGYIILTTFIIALIAFIGIFTLSLKDNVLNKILLVLVSLSAGALMGGAFLHLLPESIEESGDLNPFIFVLIGFILFFIIEKVLHWRHCHKGKCDVHTFHYMNLIGDSIHNFIDGLIIAASFIVSIPLGLTTTIAIAAHEIPQEIGDFGVLVHGGFGRFKALLLNFASALTAVVGALVVLALNVKIEAVTAFLVPFTAGGFIYIASSDLMPEMKKDIRPLNSLVQIIFLLLGLGIMLSLVLFE